MKYFYFSASVKTGGLIDGVLSCETKKKAIWLLSHQNDYIITFLEQIDKELYDLFIKKRENATKEEPK